MPGGVPCIVMGKAAVSTSRPLMGLDVRFYFFLMLIEPLNVLSRSDAPPSRVLTEVALMAAEERAEYF